MEQLVYSLLGIRYEALHDAGLDRYFQKARMAMMTKDTIAPAVKLILDSKQLRR